MAKRQINPKINGYSNQGRLERKAKLQQEGAERDTAWRELSPEQQLKILSGRPGESKRQRARIAARMQENG